MSELPKPIDDAQPDPWTELRRLTPARIALGRNAASLPTREVLAFGVAHAQARDAVHAVLDVAALEAALSPLGLPAMHLASAAPNRALYLARPDWGRRLDPDARAELSLQARSLGPALLFVIGDGLSALAAQRHAAPLLMALLPLLQDLDIGPLLIATQARVALADEIGELLGAKLVVCLIGERPGLSSPDSLGAYVTAAPRVGRTDAERNCVSNIRPEGLDPAEAAAQIAGLIRAALAAGISGVSLAYSSLAALPPAG